MTKQTINNSIKLIATDLDGTFLKDDKSISSVDFKSLERLEEKGLLRVVATGRSMHKVKEVLPSETPFNYIVFSSGGGIYDWEKQQLLTSVQFKPETLSKLLSHLLSANINFYVFKPIPNNNQFCYHQGAGECREFDNYLHRHQGDYEKLSSNNFPTEAGQIMAIIPHNEILFEQLKFELLSSIEGIKVIRTTSPVDPDFIWLEIFPEMVSKGHGIRWLCDQLGIEYTATVGIGNDFNDIDMLDFVGHPFILGNSPLSLHEKYTLVKVTNNQNGFSEALKMGFSIE
jgi:Cof subfamily protein (haloacid dehalogenase superfamily)